MSIQRAIALAAACAGLAACNIRPLPRDVVRLDTHEIVTQIRCETYNALLNRFADLVESQEKKPGVRRPAPGTGDRIRKRTLRFSAINEGVVGRELMSVVDRYERVTVGYSFLFDITEANNLKANAGFERPFARGPFGLGFEAQTDRSRQNMRKFRIVDSWGDILRDDPRTNPILARSKQSNAEICEAYDKIEPNFDYPISGKIDMQSQIVAFYNLYETGNLTGLTDKVPTMTDTVSFVSLVRGSVTPSITIAAVGDAFRLASASATAETRRTDTHKVIIVIGMPDKDVARDKPVVKQIFNEELIRQEDNENYGANRRDIRQLSEELRRF